MAKYFLLMILGYLTGSIPFSYLTAKFLGNIDIRSHGSGNSGATNVLRTLGAKAGAIAFILDFLKGFILAVIGKNLLGIQGGVIASTFVVIGHCYPFFLGFKGGKGVATAGGTIFALYPLIGVILMIIHFSITGLTRMVSLASITVAASFPIVSFILKKHISFTLYALCLGSFVIYKHRANIKRLLSGNESKIRFKK
ncbi:glycerol-3-phosphate 1-O-acyltransferase PlsY [Marinisporobacter balticus]|uniref:Glycerol-3-phosphate acyltransferase n=1 Tax=Marinisporobacter balticus TaxID=2018667 RepID=A0A4R2KM77_9FIRM|nr:glycerol-3-phosphate 1-O-acyltransferase PlsY [Marinisporobacter balticus]TCO75181.1 acyl-phosphate glycerol-3-phosphate acyltransferase [Marinisporobacter balticus]